MGRRTFLSILGGGAISAAGASWGLTRDPTAARAAWDMAGSSSDDPRIRWLSWAILAPNPHNRQPWMVDLSAPDVITVFAQHDRRLPHTDPFDRQTTIGLGAFLELARMAVAAEGIRLDTEPFPSGSAPDGLDARPIARMTVAAGTAKSDPLFVHAGARRTNRAAYDLSRPVAPEAIATIRQAAGPDAMGWTADPQRVKRLRGIAWRAMTTELKTSATARESIDLTRIGKAEIIANPDGISLAGPLMESLSIVGLLSREAMADPASSGFQSMLAAQRPQFDTAMAFVWVMTDGNDRKAQLEAGRSYLRANLAATSLGIAMQPFSQALQEYAEMVPSFTELHDALAPPEGSRVQMFARLGFASPPSGSPRWPLATRIMKA
ncbi:twin-arginine translocation pathway signal protein [Sphingobium algorifonticola]|uniref:Twin-arginine translocation pathway signal protein n=1 Tax=Sphingobium algorifonticola TaxID=2008318 RepID=A0A437J583_9SPHN|nr:twin-arginine translocation pathway signal protein [Sphingobium algorifonticola]